MLPMACEPLSAKPNFWPPSGGTGTGWEEMQPVTEAKRKAMLAHKQNPSPSTRDALRAARSKAQQTSRRCANEYWQNLCAKTQLAADCSHAKGMYEGIKTATGPTSVKTAPHKSKTGEVITDQSMQLHRWVEHYLELYSTQNIVTDTALDTLSGLSVIEEFDNTPTLEELSIAISLGEQKRALQVPPEDWLPSKAPGDQHLPSLGHAEYGLFLWGHLQCLPCQQWSKAGLCPCSNPVRGFLLDAAPVCHCRLYRRCLRPDEVRRQTLQHRQTPRQNQSLRGAHTGAAVCRQRCFNIPQRGGPPTSGRQAVPRLQGVWANDQPQEDQHPGASC